VEDLIEKLMEQDFGDTFQPISDEDFDERIRQMDENELTSAIISSFGDMKPDSLVSLYENWTKKSVMFMLFNDLSNFVGRIKDRAKLERMFREVREIVRIDRG
jgi:hypothetical protein